MRIMRLCHRSRSSTSLTKQLMVSCSFTILQAASKAARDAQAGPRLRCLYDVCRRADGLAMQGQAGGKKRAHVLVMYVTVSNF